MPPTPERRKRVARTAVKIPFGFTIVPRSHPQKTQAVSRELVKVSAAVSFDVDSWRVHSSRTPLALVVDLEVFGGAGAGGAGGDQRPVGGGHDARGLALASGRNEIKEMK